MSEDVVAPGDLDAVTAQLGRPARGVVRIAARGADGQPLVVATAPRLPDGTPFPTFYYLTHPTLVTAASRLEADGRMRAYGDLLADPDIATAYARAHDAYLADRAAVADVAVLAGTSAGGMPSRVKCLHALVAHSLAAGPGVNPIGDRALAEIVTVDAAAGALVGPLAAPPRV